MSLSILVVAALATAPTPPSVYALVVGNNRSADPSVEDLRYADDDAVEMYRLLRQAGARAVLLVTPDSDTRLLYPDLAPDGGATLPNLLQSWRTLQAEMTAAKAHGRPTEFILFFSGHGDVDHGEGFVSLEGDRLTRTRLHEDLLRHSRAGTNHVIVDACKSYFLALGKGPGGSRTAHPHVFADRAAPTNTGFVLSSTAGRDSHEWERFQAGVFSYEVRSALRGAADADGDGRITYAEVGGFLSRANQAVANPGFRPHFVVLPPAAAPSQTILAWMPSTDVLHLGAEAGHVYLEDARGVRLLDSHSANAQPIGVRLPLERPLFVRRAGDEEERAIERPGDAQFAMLVPVPSGVQRKGALHLAFEQLFAVPFDAEAVRGYAAQLAVAKNLDAPEQNDWRDATRRACPWVVGASTAAALAATGIALERAAGADGLSHADLMARNRVIGAMNVASGAFYGLAAAAAGVWLFVGPPADRGTPARPLGIVPTATGAVFEGSW